MAKPNPDCPKCHGTGWALKPGTQTQAPCRDCVGLKDEKVWNYFQDDHAGDEKDIEVAFPEYPE